MAADTVIIQLRADTAKFQADLKGVRTDLRGVEDSGTKAGRAVENSFKKAEDQAKKTKTATKQTTGGFNEMAGGLRNIAASMGLAFGVQQVIQFGKASVEAFVDAEKNAQLLLFALKGNEAAQGRLMAQATELQNTTVFDDDTIQQAQAFLANQGRTEEQIKKVINAAVELSTVTGVDLNTAVMQLDGTFSGQIGRLGKLDSGFVKLTDAQLANGAAADLLIEKYGGTAKAMGETTAGQVAKLKNQFGELQETIGGEILPVIQNLVDGFGKLSNGEIGSGLEFISNGFEKMTIVAQLFGPIAGITDAFNSLQNSLSDFKNGNILSGIANGYKSIADVITFGLVDTIKEELLPGVKKSIDELTEFEKAAIKVANSTDAEITAKFEELGGATNATAMEFKKFTDDMRQGILKQTFDELSASLDITETQFKELTDQTDKYGISVRVTSDAILELKNATEAQLEATFLNAQKMLGVTREEWDKYIGTIKGIPPVNEEVDDSTKKVVDSTIKAVGAYQKLANAVGSANTAFQDQAALFIAGKVTWDDVLKAAKKYADEQARVDLANKAMADATKNLNDANEYRNYLEERKNNNMLISIDYMDKVIVKESKMFEKFKMTDEQIAKRDELMKELGVTRVNEFDQQMSLIDELEDAEIRSSDGTIASIQKIIDKYNELRELTKQEQFIKDLQKMQGALSSVFQGFSDLLGAVAGDTAEFVAFQKITALIQIAIAESIAIANAIKTITATSVTPIEMIVGIATIIGSITGVMAGVINTVNSLQNPEPPAFFEGTDYLRLNGNPKGKDTIPVMAHEGEAIIPTEKNLNQPGLATAWINGNLDKYVIDKWVSPALINQEREQKKEFAESIAASMLLQSGSNFDDYRLYRLGLDQVSLLSQNNKLLGKVIQNKNPWAV